jgi:hypothetical protein
MTEQARLRSLLWFDCIAGGIVGVTMLAVSGWLAPVFGMPRTVLLATAVANLAYGSFSFSLARMGEAPLGRVRFLVVANGAWSVVCLVLAVSFAAPGSWLGAAYILAEGVFVVGLAAVEARALQAVASEARR